MRARGFDAFRYSKLAAEQGWRVQWYRGLKCPCFQEGTGGANPDCQACRGLGYQYDTAVEGRLNIRADERLRYSERGEGTEGTLLTSVPAKILDLSVRPHILVDNPLYEMGENDLLVLLDAETRQHDVLTRFDHERLRYRALVRVIEVVGVVENQRVIYESPIDYQVSPEGLVTWADGAGPDEGAKYTVQYWARPEYIARTELGASRLHGGVALPKKFTLMLRDKVALGK